MTTFEASHSEKVLDVVVKSGVDFCPFYYCFEKRVASREMVAVEVQVLFCSTRRYFQVALITCDTIVLVKMAYEGLKVQRFKHCL